MANYKEITCTEACNKLKRKEIVNIAATVTTMDENMRNKIEPKGAESIKRFEMLKEFSKTNVSIGLHIMPIIPYINDNYENLECLYNNAKESNASYVLPGTLYLRGKTREEFFKFIKEELPDFYEPLNGLYKTGSADKEYKDKLYKNVNEIKDKYGICSSYSKIMKEKFDYFNGMQMSFF